MLVERYYVQRNRLVPVVYRHYIVYAFQSQISCYLTFQFSLPELMLLWNRIELTVGQMIL
jgi:hypothetical protein